MRERIMMSRGAAVAFLYAWVLWSNFEPVTSKDPAEIAMLTKWRSISSHADRDHCEALAGC